MLNDRALEVLNQAGYYSRDNDLEKRRRSLRRLAQADAPHFPRRKPV